MLPKLITKAICFHACLSLVAAYYDRELFKSIVYDDHTNDDAIDLNAQQLLKRSGFDYEEHYVIADDGYITLLVRVVNPLVEREDLRSPPVIVYHGGLIDQTCFLVSSSIQHWPEPWPRKPSDGPMSSSNRSLAFMLANNGFDLWLVGTRGSNRHNQGHTNQVALARAETNFRLAERHFELVESDPDRYWSYGLDEIIEFEYKQQIDAVLRLAGARQMVLLVFSLSSPSSMAFLAENPVYAQQTRLYLQMSPAVAADHFTATTRIYFEQLCPALPTRGIGVLSDYWLTESLRQLLLYLSRWNYLRYSIVSDFLRTMLGPSLEFQTNLELNYLAHIFLPVSFKSIQHYCQTSVSKQLTKFDYGPEKNVKLYGQPRPPAYNVSRLEVQNWAIISGSYDAFVGAATVQRLMERTSTPKPAEHIVCPGCNHLDFQAAVENDKLVNLPILRILSSHADPFGRNSTGSATSQRADAVVSSGTRSASPSNRSEFDDGRSVCDLAWARSNRSSIFGSSASCPRSFADEQTMLFRKPDKWKWGAL